MGWMKYWFSLSVFLDAPIHLAAPAPPLNAITTSCSSCLLTLSTHVLPYAPMNPSWTSDDSSWLGLTPEPAISRAVIGPSTGPWPGVTSTNPDAMGSARTLASEGDGVGAADAMTGASRVPAATAASRIRVTPPTWAQAVGGCSGGCPACGTGRQLRPSHQRVPSLERCAVGGTCCAASRHPCPSYQ